MFRKLHSLPALTLIAGLLLAPAVQAGTLKNQNLTRLIADSQSIIQGTVAAVSDGIDERGIPYTEVTLYVRGKAKGSVAEESEYTFRQFGLTEPRTMENGHRMLAVSPEGFPRWHEGESVVAFLYKPAAATGLQTTVGLAQGKLTQVNDRLINDFGNVGLFEGVAIDPALLSPEQQNLLTSPGAVDAESFMNLVQRAVAEQWIENGEMQ